MRNPNFLVLDEPTNDLDIQTLQILEEYLQDFPGCVIVVSHDRYFTDKVVDHLLVFKGNGDIQDFPGNYSQYREWKSLKSEEKSSRQTKKEDNTNKKVSSPSNKLTYGERLEMKQLEKDIALLEEEQKKTEEALSSGNLSVDEITATSIRFAQLKDEIDQKSMRWLELSEKEEG